MKLSPALTASALALLMSAPSASARFGREDSTHDLSHAAGLASPAIQTSLDENPAGLAYSTNTQIVASARTDDQDWSPARFGAHAFFGDDRVGAGLGVFTDSQAQLGLAAEIGALNSTIGASANIDMDSGTTDMNLGFIVGSESDFRFGAAAFGVLDGVGNLGAGVATELNESATFAFDVGTSATLKAPGFKPSLGIHMPSVQLIMGYGVHFDDSNPSWIREGVAVALGFGLGQKLQVALYYNQVARYFVTLGVKF